MIELGVALGLLAYLCLVLTRCSFRVEEGHLAVLVTFGRAEMGPGKKLTTYGPGLHFKRPWQRVLTVSMKEHSLDLNQEEGGGTAMADDGTILRLDSFLRYVPVEPLLYDFLFGLEHPLEHIRGLYTCLLRNEIANFRPVAAPAESSPRTAVERFDFTNEAGSYALIRRERKLLNERITAFCHERIDNRYGIRFSAVDLADILPPDEFADALNAVIQSQSEAEARLFRAEGECQQRLLAAERGVDIAHKRAEAVAVEIKKLGEFLGGLERRGVLGAYVSRRRDEVLSESRTMFLKMDSAANGQVSTNGSGR